MSSSFGNLGFNRMRVPVRRVLALDCGHRRLKMVLAESDFGRFRLLREEMLDLKAEGLVSPEELQTNLHAAVEALAGPPLALALPQHVSISQMVDLPQAPESEVDKLIAEETRKLSGVSESRIVYDFVRAQTTGNHRQQFWVTLSQEGEIRERLVRLGVEREDICEVSTTDNALIAAYRACCPLSSRAILVELGAQTTVVVILQDGQGAFASSFQMGGDFFTRSLARLRGCTEDAADALKREKNLLTGPDALPEFVGVVDGWVAELKRQVSEWFQQNPSVSREAPAFDLVASGGGFEQPGLLDYLKRKADLPFQSWPQPAHANSHSPAKGYEVAYGLALLALGHSAQPISLLPEDYRAAWRKRQGRQRVELASLALICVCALLLAIGTWQKTTLIRAKKALREKVLAGQRAVDENDALTASLDTEYENLRPVFAAQQNTIDTLKTLALLQQTRDPHGFWYVLLADQESYFSQPPAVLMTNRPARSNLLGTAVAPARSALPPLRVSTLTLTNFPVVKPGFIAELSVPGDAEASRQTISELVNRLKRFPLYSKVDLLSDDLRRNLADPKVTVPERDFVLSLDFSGLDFQQSLPIKKPPQGLRRRKGRQGWEQPQPGDNVTQNSVFP